MRWVKASEQLPEINKNVIMRFPWHDNTIVLDEGKLKPKEERDNQLWFSTNNYGSIPEREDGLEWLDESTPTQSGESMEDAVAFANFIVDNYTPLEGNEYLWMQSENNKEFKTTKIPDITQYTTSELYQLFKHKPTTA